MSDFNITLQNKTQSSALLDLEKFAYGLGYNEISINERVGNITYKRDNGGFKSLVVSINIIEINDNTIKLAFNFPNKSDLGFSKKRFMKKAFNEMVELINA